jgi:hypothetical protein
MTVGAVIREETAVGKREREVLRTELEKLGKINEEGPEFYAQNAKVAAAEKNVTLVENLLVRAQVG